MCTHTLYLTRSVQLSVMPFWFCPREHNSLGFISMNITWLVLSQSCHFVICRIEVQTPDTSLIHLKRWFGFVSMNITWLVLSQSCHFVICRTEVQTPDTPLIHLKRWLLTTRLLDKKILYINYQLSIKKIVESH